METPSKKPPVSITPPPRVLVVNAPYYQAVSNALFKGAAAALDAAQAKYETVTVAGALEIPVAIAMAHQSKKYEGYIALGCVIRGETSHYDVVAMLSAQGLMEFGVNNAVAVANGILTVDNEAQALARADRQDKGGHAARACLELIALQRKLKSTS